MSLVWEGRREPLYETRPPLQTVEVEDNVFLGEGLGCLILCRQTVLSLYGTFRSFSSFSCRLCPIPAHCTFLLQAVLPPAMRQTDRHTFYSWDSLWDHDNGCNSGLILDLLAHRPLPDSISIATLYSLWTLPTCPLGLWWA